MYWDLTAFLLLSWDMSGVTSQQCGSWSGKRLRSAGLVIDVQRKVMYKKMMFLCCCLSHWKRIGMWKI